jgi:hypothetical protein
VSTLRRILLDHCGSKDRFLQFKLRDEADGSLYIVVDRRSKEPESAYLISDTGERIYSPSKGAKQISYHTSGRVEFHDMQKPPIYCDPIFEITRVQALFFKAFNSIMFYALSELGKPEGAPERLAIPVAGDDAQTKQIVMGLVNDMGFDPVDGGSLAESWRQQPSTPAYCCDYDAQKTRDGIAAAVKGKAETIRDTAWREKYGRLFAGKPAYADVHADVIAMNRSLNPL